MSTITMNSVRAAHGATVRQPTRRSAERRLNHDLRRPRVHRWQPAAPARRPTQPATPVADLGYRVAAAPRSQRVAGTSSWQLTDRGLAVLMSMFTLAIVLGAVVVVTQYLALA